LGMHFDDTQKTCESASLRVREPEKNHIKLFLSIGSSWKLQKLGVHFDDTREDMRVRKSKSLQV